MARQGVVARTFVELADSLVDDFDVVDLLTLLTDRCVDVLDVSAAGLALLAPEGDLRVVASSSDAARVVELFELEAQDGPCLDAYRLGRPVTGDHLTAQDERWPRFAPVAVEAGFRCAHALPMRLRGTTIGALNLFRTEAGAMNDDDLVVGQAMADVATIAILQHRAQMEAQLVADQLQHALNSRIVIEQAKGVLAERRQLHIEDAFEHLRALARRDRRLLADVAHDVIDGRLS